jgi:hypothetical protein
MARIGTVRAKLAALKRTVRSRLEDPRARYFDPPTVLEYFAGGRENYLKLPELVPVTAATQKPEEITLSAVTLPSLSAEGSEPELSANESHIASLIARSSADRSGWAYLGTFEDETWSETTISTPASLPAQGDTLSPSRDLFIRRDKPRWTFPFRYELGPEVAVASAGSELRVEEVVEVGRNRVWARVDLLQVLPTLVSLEGTRMVLARQRSETICSETQRSRDCHNRRDGEDGCPSLHTFQIEASTPKGRLRDPRIDCVQDNRGSCEWNAGSGHFAVPHRRSSIRVDGLSSEYP